MDAEKSEIKFGNLRSVYKDPEVSQAVGQILTDLDNNTQQLKSENLKLRLARMTLGLIRKIDPENFDAYTKNNGVEAFQLAGQTFKVEDLQSK